MKKLVFLIMTGFIGSQAFALVCNSDLCPRPRPVCNWDGCSKARSVKASSWQQGQSQTFMNQASAKLKSRAK